MKEIYYKLETFVRFIVVYICLEFCFRCQLKSEKKKKRFYLKAWIFLLNFTSSYKVQPTVFEMKLKKQKSWNNV